ncbi:MAG: hypothetical protein AB7O63_10660 [Reyranellaceae bacterium]
MKVENWNLVLTVGGIDYTVSLVFAAVFLVSFAVFTTLLLLGARRFAPGASEGCHWQRSRDHDRPGFRGWHCLACNALAYSSGRRPPRECKKTLKSKL